jgi:zinc D-Ala-D-Ala carboxypeptidase
VHHPVLTRPSAALAAVLLGGALALTAAAPATAVTDVLPDPAGSAAHPRPFPAPLPTPVQTDAADALATLLASRSVDDPASPWVVVNKVRPLVPVDSAPAELVAVGAVLVQPVVAEPLAALVQAAAADGVTIPLLSGYRSYTDQQRVYAGWVSALGQERADEVSARPGHSEHQTGLAVDVGSASDPACQFEACYAQTVEGRWLTERAGEFGFVVRYTEEGRASTGFDAEGWHLRWVGTDLVAALATTGATTLEDLFALPGGPTYP